MSTIHSPLKSTAFINPHGVARSQGKLPVFFCLLFLAASLVQSQAHICNVRYSHAVPSALKNGEQLMITFDYVTETAGGERIFIRPLTAGRLSAGYSASGSPLYNGTGTDTASFTIVSGKVTVDGLRINIYNADQSRLIHSADIPVEFLFGDAGANIISPAAGAQSPLLFNDQVNIQFRYNIGVPGGARIFVRPFSGASLSPNYSASGSALYLGTGTDTVQFTIMGSQPIKVDKLRVQIYNADQSQLVTEYFLPVEYYFGTTRITNFQLRPTPAHITVPGDQVTMSFQYSTTESAGVRIFPRPFVNGAAMADYGASGSPLYTGSGSGDAFFTKTTFTVPQVVDHVHIQVLDPNQTVTLLDYMAPLPTAAFSFGTTYLSNIRLFPGPEATLDDGQIIYLDFDYRTDNPGNVVIFARPFTTGSLTADYAAHPSPFYATGTGHGNGWFTISSGNATVDQIRFQVLTADQSKLLMEFFVPVRYNFFGLPVLSLRRRGGAMELSWESRLGKTYQLQSSPGLPRWGNFGSPVIGTGGPMSIVDDSPLASLKFYRLSVSD